MKTVKSVGGGIAERVSDEVAARKVDNGTHVYCPKSEVKKSKPKKAVEAKSEEDKGQG